MTSVPARSAWVSISLVIACLVLLNFSFAADTQLDASKTSYGKVELGYGAVHDLLRTLNSSVGRSRKAYTALSTQRTLWLIQPDFLREHSESAKARERGLGSTASQDLLAWLERGGTAVVFGGEHSEWQSLGLARVDAGATQVETTKSKLGPRRALALDGLQCFAEDEELTPLVTLEEAPFIVRKSVGRGTLIAVADSRPFDNGHLTLADHSNLAVDLARTHGAPLFDEYGHGFVEQHSLLEALGRPRAVLLGATLALCALLLILHLRRHPESKLVAATGPEQGLGSFVDPLAMLYSRKAPRHAAAVYRAYLHGVRYRLRGLLHGSGGASDAALDRRLDRDLAHDSALREALSGTRAPQNLRELEDGVRKLERYVASVANTHGTSRR